MLQSQVPGGILDIGTSENNLDAWDEAAETVQVTGFLIGGPAHNKNNCISSLLVLGHLGGPINRDPREGLYRKPAAEQGVH